MMFNLDDDFLTIKNKIKFTLRKHKISVSKAQRESGLTTHVLYNFLNGKTKSLSIDSMRKINKYLDSLK